MKRVPKKRRPARGAERRPAISGRARRAFLDLLWDHFWNKTDDRRERDALIRVIEDIDPVSAAVGKYALGRK